MGEYTEEDDISVVEESEVEEDDILIVKESEVEENITAWHVLKMLNPEYEISTESDS